MRTIQCTLIAVILACQAGAPSVAIASPNGEVQTQARPRLGARIAAKWRRFTGREKKAAADRSNLNGLTPGGNAGWTTALTIGATTAAKTEPVLAVAYGSFALYNLVRGVSKTATIMKMAPEKPSKRFISATVNGVLALGLGAVGYLTGDAIFWGFAATNAVNGALKVTNHFPYVKN